MNAESILAAINLTKAEKCRRLFDLGYTRRQVADMVCGGNLGWAYNIYKKHMGVAIVPPAQLAAIFTKIFGVEIEAYGVSKSVLAAKLNAAGIRTAVEGYNHSTRTNWKIVSDGSLVGDNTFELVSPILQGDAGLASLKTVCEVLEACGAKVNKTCGLHIHFNARNLSLDAWKNIYKNYIRLEGEIDKMMPVSRRGNSNGYCRSLLNRYSTAAEAFRAIDNCESVTDISNSIAGRTRYCKINAESFERHGSIEFRQHSGTIEYKKISSWIKILNAILDKSTSGSVNLMTDLLDSELLAYFNSRKAKLAA